VTTDVYKAPDADLEVSVKKLSASERLAQSRRDMEESSAVSRLNLIWGFRLIVDVIWIGFFIYTISIRKVTPLEAEAILYMVMIAVSLAEIYFIVGYFRRKRWCVVPLHIFSAISLINIPLGTVLSVLHFINMRKIQFDS